MFRECNLKYRIQLHKPEYMDQKLRLAFQECFQKVASRSKVLNTIRFTCMQPPTASAVVKIVYLNLDTAVAEGRGLHWYFADNLNSIILKFQGADVLPLSAVEVHFSRLGAELVDVNCSGGTVEILYRADGDDALGLTVTVYDQIVSESIAELTVSSVFPASTVLSGLRNGREVDVRFTEWMPGKRFQLLYRSSRDGAFAAPFHRLCDDQGPTVTLIKSIGGYVFGGYAGVAWSSGPKFHACPSAFLFTVTNPHGDPITRFMSNGDWWAVKCHFGHGPTFGASDLAVYGEYDGESFTNFPNSYTDTRGRGEATFTGACFFTAEVVEVWAVE